MNLRDQLKGILPEILPESPADAIKGTELIRLVKFKLENEYSDATLRYHFSIMCCDPSSPIAKVDRGQGYYLRPPINSLEGAHKLIRMSQGLLIEQDPQVVDLALSRRNKFCAVFSRYHEADNRFPYLFEGGLGEDVSRDAVWRLPDAALIEWDLGTAGADEFEIDQTSAQLKRHLGGQPFALTSVTIKLAADYRDFRQDFFQCVSNSSWAHRGELIFAGAISDRQLVNELGALGNRFGIAITTFGLDLEAIDSWPDTRTLTAMSAKEFDALTEQLSPQRIALGDTVNALDWGALSALRKDSEDLEQLLGWVSQCLEAGRVLSYAEFQQESPSSPPEKKASLAAS